MSKIRIDPLSALIRIYEEDIDPTDPIGEVITPYYKTVTAVFLDNGRVRLQGALVAPSLAECRDIDKALKSMGYTGVEWRRAYRETGATCRK